jgi:hypothetical protein
VCVECWDELCVLRMPWIVHVCSVSCARVVVVCVCVYCVVLCWDVVCGWVGGILCCVHMSLSCVVQCVCGGGGTRCNSLLSPSVYVMLTRSTCNKSWTELS